MSTLRTVPAVLVALVAGALYGVRFNAGPILVDVVAIDQVGFVLQVLAVCSLVASPFGALAAGYLWGTDADVPASALAFLGGTVAATAGGFVVAYVVTLLLVVLGGGPADLLGKLFFDGLYALALLEVPLAALAGGTLAHSRRESGNSSTAQA